jgi:hypothetical protein
MKAEQVRRWLGSYVTTFVAILAMYILLAGDTWLLPLEPSDKIAAFEIVIPFLLAQVTMVFSYYGTNSPPDVGSVNLPPFLVKGPLLLATACLVVTMIFMAIGGYSSAAGTPSAQTFNGVLTFFVAFLSASSVFIIRRVFVGN